MDFSAAIFYSFIFSLFMNLLMRGITATEREEIEKEEQNNMFMESPKFSVSKEAASIFKIISVIISFTPLLSSIIIGFIYTPKLFNGLFYPVHSNNNRIKCLYQYCKRVRQGNRNNQCGNRNKISDVLRLPYHGDNVDLLIIEKEAS
jgi:hypothetical protein